MGDLHHHFSYRFEDLPSTTSAIRVHTELPVLSRSLRQVTSTKWLEQLSNVLVPTVQSVLACCKLKKSTGRFTILFMRPVARMKIN